MAEVAQAHDGSLGMAHAYIDGIANAVLSLQDENGGLLAGYNANGSRLGYFVTEHQLNGYGALMDMFSLTGDEGYKEAADISKIPMENLVEEG